MFTYNTDGETEDNVSLLDHLSSCFGFFVCPCYSQRPSYPMLKISAQNIPEWENQGKQCELSDHWKSIKTFFFGKQITGDHAKMTKWLTGV